MRHFLPAVILIAWTIFLLPVSASGLTSSGMQTTPSAQPTPAIFEIDVVVETLGVGIPDGINLETDFGMRRVDQHQELGRNHYRDYLKVRLDSTVLWIFEHEGNLSTENGHRNDESWELFSVIAETPFALTVLLHNPTTQCQDPTRTNCNRMNGTGNKPVFILDRNKRYEINLNVEYTRGADSQADSFVVTASIR